MSALARIIARKAAKTTVKHSARGVAAKASRRPIRSATLVGVGVALGIGVGWLAGRSGRATAAAHR